jgi:Uma2 family endonuclease
MTTTLARTMTLEQFLALPERKPALEFADGEVTQKVAPKAQHARLQYKLAEMFNNFAESRRLAMAFTEARATWARLSQVPDVAVYRWQRIPRTPDGEIANDLWEPPDIAAEILSPGQSLRDQIAKCRRYVERGVPSALLVIPRRERSVRVFRDDGTDVTLTGDDVIDLSPVLPGLVLTARALFATLRID